MTDDRLSEQTQLPSDIALPRFAVVGHPNKGKSSIVATLAQDDSIYIDRLSGSTTKAHYFPMLVDGETLYELIDTPGFQRARAVLDWLQHHCQDVSQRADAVTEFCDQHESDPRFQHELELLRPISKGAGIIYVVDGSRPYGSEYEAEMEILRWTGQPSLALINPIDNDDYLESWRNALGQYFKTVRVFNAQTAQYEKRIGLLEVFGQLDPNWQNSLLTAVENLKQMRVRQHQQAAEIICDCLVEVLQHSEVQAVPGGFEKNGISDAIESSLQMKYQATIRQIEQYCRRRLSEIFNYYQLKTDESALDFLNQDLFDQSRWYLFGLSKKQLIGTAAAAGASAGVVLDIGTGGHSLLLGSAIGGLAGGFGAWKLSDKIAKFSIKGIPTAGMTLSYGPVVNLNFPFVVLGRALQHHRLICLRTHAARDVLNIPSDQNPLDQLSTSVRTQFMSAFHELKQDKRVQKNREKLIATLVEILQAVDQHHSPS